MAVIDRGGFLFGDEKTLFHTDFGFVAKPKQGFGGENIFFCYKKENLFYMGNKLTPKEDCLAILIEHAQQTPFVIQECLKNHPDIEGITNGSLAVARIVTYRKVGDGIALLGAVFQTPFGALEVSNGGIVFPVNPENGEILHQAAWPLLGEPRTTHPDPGEAITKKVLPCWNEAINSVIQAHSALEGIFSLGWDVAFTPQGPKVIEANINWNIHLIQQCLELPLGKSEFARTVLKQGKQESFISP